MTDILPRPEGGAIEGAQLTGCHAVVTGATRGIGRAIAEALAGLGANLTLMGRVLKTRRRFITKSVVCSPSGNRTHARLLICQELYL